MTAPSLVWFRQDLRLHDQAAFAEAAARGPVIPVYVLDDEDPGDWAIGAAQRWWLHHSLASLAADLQERGLRLVLRRGRAADALAKLAEETGAHQVHALRHYEPWWREAEQALSAHLELCLHDGNQLAPPDSVKTATGGRYRIYSPYWRALQSALPPAPPQPTPVAVTVPSRWPKSERLADWGLLPTRPNWAEGFERAWQPGEAGAASRLADFAERVADYGTRRDYPSEEGSARLSPHLHFGEISPASVWHGLPDEGAAKFRKELAWRDFAQNMLLQFAELGEAHGRGTFDAFPWRSGRDAADDIEAWRRGRTGYPLVDAGMRELWATGWMHNRVRMVAASFLVKHLLVDWRQGARWFWDTLVDADYGNNSLNWQWIAGTGVDSNPFGRIMAPLLQSEKFDAAAYIRRWVPELADFADENIHDPDDAAYFPKRIGHREARERALAALAESRAAR